MSPTQNALNVSKIENITVTFSSSMNTATLNASNIFVYGLQSGKHTGTMTLSVDTAFIFNPTTDFKAGEMVTVALTKHILGAAGDSLPNGWHQSFTISATSSPGTFGSQVLCATRDSPQSVYACDVDGDGDADILTANRNSWNASVLKNNADGTFQARVEYKTGDGPGSVYASDIDGDGDIDILVANTDYGSTAVSILRICVPLQSSRMCRATEA